MFLPSCLLSLLSDQYFLIKLLFQQTALQANTFDRKYPMNDNELMPVPKIR